MPTIDLANAVLAVGSLGTASFALVDATKAFGGGISNRGLGRIKHAVGRLLQADRTAFRSVTETLRANWINGTASLNDQKAIAKTLIKLQLTPDNAAHMAAETGVDPGILKQVATDYQKPNASLSSDEQNVAGRFDLQLASLLDEAYQRADQSYRNSAKVLAIGFAVALAIVAKLALEGTTEVPWGEAIIAGVLAAPLAPVSKDLASALQAAVKAMQVIRG
jgi:hypothetical protein